MVGFAEEVEVVEEGENGGGVSLGDGVATTDVVRAAAAAAGDPLV